MGYAWVTLATNDSYALGALVLAHTLRQAGTQHALAILITPGVTPSMKQKLGGIYNFIKEVDILDSRDEAHLHLLRRPELGVTFTKLYCWRMTEFEKCVFLDADVMVLENVDELFLREELSAAPDVGWPDCFNSGVFVFRPSNDTFLSLLNYALQHGSFDGGDQGLLNLYFNTWAHGDITKHLPFVYNMCSTASYSYLPAFKQFGFNAKIVHFIGHMKPWLLYFNTETRQVEVPHDMQHLKPILQKWWDIFCFLIHPTLSSDMAGLAGAFAKLKLGTPRTCDQLMLDDHLRRQSWEMGNIDYLGRDSFDMIWNKICQTLASTSSTADLFHVASNTEAAGVSLDVVTEDPHVPEEVSEATKTENVKQDDKSSDVKSGPTTIITSDKSQTVKPTPEDTTARSTPIPTSSNILPLKSTVAPVVSSDSKSVHTQAQKSIEPVQSSRTITLESSGTPSPVTEVTTKSDGKTVSTTLGSKDISQTILVSDKKDLDIKDVTIKSVPQLPKDVAVSPSVPLEVTSSSIARNDGTKDTGNIIPKETTPILKETSTTKETGSTPSSNVATTLSKETMAKLSATPKETIPTVTNEPPKQAVEIPPVQHKEVGSVQPKDVAPVQQKAVTPIHPKEVAPIPPKEVAPIQPKKVDPIQPKDVAAIQPKDVVAIQTKEVAPIQPKEVSPIQPKDVAPIQPKEVAPIQPKKVASVQPKEITPIPSKETVPSLSKTAISALTAKVATPLSKDVATAPAKEVVPTSPKESAPATLSFPDKTSTSAISVPKELQADTAGPVEAPVAPPRKGAGAVGEKKKVPKGKK